MGIFWKSRGRDQGPADDALSFFSRDQADEFRALVGATLGARGLEVEMMPDHAVDAAGRQFGLWNLAAQCVEARRREWPRLTAEHVDRVLASLDAPDPFETLTADEAARQTYARLYDEGAMPSFDGFPHREFVPGVVELLALDLPETVAIYNREHASRLGGWERLRQHGVDNLRALPVEHLEQVDVPGGGSFHTLLGDSVHTASRALLLPELAATLAGQEDAGHGWLMSIPNRHQVAWHMIRDSSVIPVVSAMAHVAGLGYADAPSPLSPHVYWWDGSGYQQLTRIDADGTRSVHAGPEFTEMLNEVVGGEQGGAQP